MECIEEINGLEDGFEIMVAVRPFIKYLQAQVDLGKGIQLEHFRIIIAVTPSRHHAITSSRHHP